MNGLPRVGDGFQADIRVGDHHLRLFSEVYQLGFVSVVYDVTARQEINRQNADSLEDGKLRAAEGAAEYVRHAYGLELPDVVEWEMNPQMRAR
jgi:hypothetical protein